VPPIEPLFFIEPGFEAEFGVVDNFFVPLAILLEEVGLVVESVVVGHGLVDEDRQPRLGGAVVCAHVCVGDGEDVADVELLGDDAAGA
jgi:hypothetical protein